MQWYLGSCSTVCIPRIISRFVYHFRRSIFDLSFPMNCPLIFSLSTGSQLDRSLHSPPVVVHDPALFDCERHRDLRELLHMLSGLSSSSSTPPGGLTT